MEDALPSTVDAELSTMLGYDKHDRRNKKTTNAMNCSYKKGVRFSLRDLSLNISRDRDGGYESLIVRKGYIDVFLYL